MKRFQYTLEGVLSFRRQEEERCQAELAAALRRLETERQRQRQIEDAIHRALQTRIQTPPTTAGDLLQWDRYMGRQRAALDAQAAVVATAAATVETRRQELLAARVEVRKLERHDEWALAARRQDQQRLDEIGTLMTHWKARAV